MDEIEYLKRLQGDMTQVQFAALLGISQPFISMIYRGERRLGLASLQKLIGAFPDERANILRVFLFAPDYRNRDSVTENVMQQEAAR